MYDLTKIITRFNKIHGTKISVKKNWGLFYLRPNNLSFLNKSFVLRKNAFFYTSHFTINPKASRDPLAEGKYQASLKAPSVSLKDIYKRNKDKAILQRLNWEEHLCDALNKQAWEEKRDQLKGKVACVQYLHQAETDWNTHQPFQYYSSESLLFLLGVIVEYQHHFSEAHKELQRKKQTWIYFRQLPAFIAEDYESFLKKELKNFTSLRKRVLAALLLHLETVEQQGLVTCDDVSYTLALKSQWLGLSELELPECRMVLDTNTFNQIQRAIEKYGEDCHADQLYQLAWYQYKKFCNADEFTTITMSDSRLLIPSALLVLIPKKKKKWFGLFSSDNINIALPFLETQQALLAQLLLQPVKDTAILKPISAFYPALLTLSTQYQLLQQSRCSFEQQRLRWWQWEKKRWNKAWQKWLGQQLEKKQVSLLNKLNENFEEVKRYNLMLPPEQVQVILEGIQTLISEGMSNSQSLTNMFKYFNKSAGVKEEEESTEKMHLSTSEEKRVKQDLAFTVSSQIRPMTSKKNDPVDGSQQDVPATESSANAQLVNSNQGNSSSFMKKWTGLLQTKTKGFLGKDEAVSTEKNSATNEPTPLLTSCSA